MVDTARVSVFFVIACGNERATFGIDMDENNTPTPAANLGALVVMAVAPIVVYVTAMDPGVVQRS
jgi:hypothetical protein